MLSPDEQQLFRVLGVFVEVPHIGRRCGGAGRREGADSQVMEEIAALVDKSLLQREEQADGEPRFRMLETIREFALEQLAAAGDLERAREEHARFFLARAEEAERAMLGPAEQVWLDRLEAEHVELRAGAVLGGWRSRRAARHRGRAAGAAGAFGASGMYAATSSEGRQWLEGALTAATTLPIDMQAKAYYRAGSLAENQADFGRAQALLADALRLYRDGRSESAWATRSSAWPWWPVILGEYAQATAWLNESVALFRRLGHQRGIIACLNTLGHVAIEQGDYRSARRLLEEAAQAAAEGGIDEYRAIILNNLGEVARSSGDYDAARRLHEESSGYQARAGRQGRHRQLIEWTGQRGLRCGRLDAAEGPTTTAAWPCSASWARPRRRPSC